MVGIDWEGVLAIIMGTLMLLVPIAGLTARFALKPIVEAVVRLRQAPGAADHLALIEQRMALMEQQLANTESDVGRLLEVQEFQEKLLTKTQEEGS